MSRSAKHKATLAERWAKDHGPQYGGRRSVWRPDRRGVSIRASDGLRRPWGLWRSKWRGCGWYLRPEWALRAIRRAERWIAGNNADGMPCPPNPFHIERNHDTAMGQLRKVGRWTT